MWAHLACIFQGKRANDCRMLIHTVHQALYVTTDRCQVVSPGLLRVYVNSFANS